MSHARLLVVLNMLRSSHKCAQKLIKKKQSNDVLFFHCMNFKTLTSETLRTMKRHGFDVALLILINISTKLSTKSTIKKKTY